MKEELTKKIESIFRNSTSQDELFDAFDEAVKNNIRDFDLYKILLANPFLSSDEIKMYTEKILKDSPFNSYSILMWTAKIFENRDRGVWCAEDSFNYYLRAFNFNSSEAEPLIGMLNLYNIEINSGLNKNILSSVVELVHAVKFKSVVYSAMAALFKKKGDLYTASKYLALAEKAAESERHQF